jgi:predicted RNA-binding protein YlxR (DUF448 family)
MAENDRLRAIQRGDYIGDELDNRVGQQSGLEDYYLYRGLGEYDALAQTPGYTPDEQANIIREGELRDLLNIDYGSNYLSPWEEEQIYGNPYRGMDAFNPGATEGIAYDWTGYISDALSQQEGQLGHNLDRTRSELGAAIDPSRLSLSGAYQSNQDRVLSQTAGGVNAAIDPGKLGLSQEYQRSYEFGPEDEQRMVTQAASGAGARYAGLADEAERRMAAAGTTNPLALAAIKERLANDAAAESWDAVNDMRIRAKQLGLDVAQNREMTRLGAERDIAGRRTQAAFGLGDMALGAGSEREQLRLGAERGISDRLLRAAETAGRMGQEGIQYAGSSRLSNEQQMANRLLGLGERNQERAIDLLRSGEAEQQRRAAYVAGNRQDVNMANQANRFNRGYQTSGALSGRYTGVADARREGQREGREYSRWGQQQASGNVNTANQQRIGLYGTQGNLMQNATGNQMRYRLGKQQIKSQRPGLFSRIAGGVLGAATGFATGGYMGAARGAYRGASGGF